MKSGKTRLNPTFAASCDAMVNIESLFILSVFSVALDREQRNVKMSSGHPCCPHPGQWVIHQAGQSSKANFDHVKKEAVMEPSSVLHPESNKVLLRSQAMPYKALLALCLICQHHLMFNCGEVNPTTTTA